LTRGLLARIAVATTVPLVVAATCVLSQSPAAAEACTTEAGVTVVVDQGALGGGIATVCDPGSGEVASTRFEQNGFALTFAQRQPGFVCRVNGVPASDPCVNTSPVDAYWGLFWTDGESGSWTYSTLGATSLDVPDGGAVALAWQQGAARRTPGVPAPVRAAPSPTPTEKPTPTPTEKPTPVPTRTPTAVPTPTASSAPTTSPTSSVPASPTGSPSSPGSPTGSPTRSPTDSATVEPREPTTTEPTTTEQSTTEPSATPGDASTPTEPRAADDESSRVPTWLTIAILVMLLVAIGMSTVAARRRTHD
jgi:hypothetical protein